MSSRGDSGYMSQYDSIYSQKSEVDSFDHLNDVEYVDYPTVRSSMPSPYNDRRDEHIEKNGTNRHTYHTSNHNSSFGNDSLYPPLPNQRYQYSTSPNSNSYEYNRNEFSSFESNRDDPPLPPSPYKPPLSPRPHLIHYSTSPLISPRLPPQQSYTSQGNPPELYIPKPSPRSASLQNISRSESSPRLNTSFPVNMVKNNANIRPYPYVDTPKTLNFNNNNNFYQQEKPEQVLDAFDFSETQDIIDSYYDDHEVNEQEITRNRKREAAVKEVLTTERTYVDGLRKLVNVFLSPLRENYQRSINKILSTKPVATNDEISAIFGNIEQLLTLHEQLLKSLEERNRNWSPTQRISDIFLQTAPYLKMYIIYLKSFPQAITTMERLNKESKDFKKFLQQCQQKPELGGLPFNSFLSLPIQRIPRYKLLTEALLKHTKESHPDYQNLKKCVAQISAIAEEVNEKIRDAENQQKVLEIQATVTNLPKNIVDPARRFIYNGNLYKVTPRQTNNKPFFTATQDLRAHFLFNDLLLFCLDFQGIYHYKGEIDLRFATVKEIDDDSADQPFCFQILTTDVRNGAHTVRATSFEEKNEWITRLKGAIWSLQNGRVSSNSDGKQLDNDVETLYSCILVNRLWFTLAVPELWKNPFVTMSSGNPKHQGSLIDVYIACLPKKVRENIYSGTTRSPIFNYAKYLRCIIIGTMCKCVSKWIISKKDELLSLYYVHVTGIANNETVIVKTLCDYFISCSTRIDEVDLSYRPINLFLNPNLSRIKTFRCSVMFLPDLLEAGIVKSASKIANDIQFLEIRFICSYNFSSGTMNTPVNDIIDLIESQNNLQHVLLQCTPFEFLTLMVSICTHTKTLTSIDLFKIAFGCGLPLQYLAKLENLQHLSFICCNFSGTSDLNVDDLSFQRLKSITIKVTNIQVDILETLIRQARDSIRVLEIRNFRNLRELIYSCRNNCTLLTKLIVSINQGTLLSIISMITTCRNLEEIHIFDETMQEGFYMPIDIKCTLTADEFICQLGMALPEKVHTIRFIMDWFYKSSSLDTFFNQCNARRLKRLEFSNCSFFSSRHLDVVVRHCGKTLRYLSFNSYHRMSREYVKKVSKIIPNLVVENDEFNRAC
ncbi:7628_t:CDS:2 [Funneliformis geosporum]|uniref:16872_t:CDS:1 n=1 Tax=Funneliformis geosporum TaxID=1117311 RepID=A0A9W4SBP7_9GLOM|nr:16872_t:CDS:2 [Funneliformis geosporum]CAI2161689.1 7628_t:CDS:2 [Funneliformis geosporum]